MYNEKQQAVLMAARGVFLRYGFKRVTMHELALAAHISRPGLYLLFPSKEEVFLGVVRKELSETISAIVLGLPQQDTLAQKLSYAFDIWTMKPFELVSQSPEARELFECEFEFVGAVMEEGNTEFEVILAKLLREGPASLPRGLTPDRAAHVLRCASYGFKRQASNAPDLKTMLDDMLALVTIGPSLTSS